MDFTAINNAMVTALTTLAGAMGDGAATILPIALPLMGVPMLVRYVRRIFSTAS